MHKERIQFKKLVILNVIDNIDWKQGMLKFRSAYTRDSFEYVYTRMEPCEQGTLNELEHGRLPTIPYRKKKVEEQRVSCDYVTLKRQITTTCNEKRRSFII